MTERSITVKGKTFATPLKIFAAIRELQDLDEQVAAFLSEEKAAKACAMSDTTTTVESGEAIGLIRSVAHATDDA